MSRPTFCCTTERGWLLHGFGLWTAALDRSHDWQLGRGLGSAGIVIVELVHVFRFVQPVTMQNLVGRGYGGDGHEDGGRCRIRN